MIRVIKTDAEYNAALAMIETLTQQDPRPDSVEGERLELLVVLVQDYETKQFELGVPNPIDAIRFRMEQQGLAPKDLIPFLGSRSRVSEVLSGKRTLTLPMIRALHTGLSIPAEILMSADVRETESALDWGRFPLAEMLRRGWINATGSLSDLQANAESVLTNFFEPVGPPQRLVVLFRRTAHVRGGREMDRYALAAWSARILLLATNTSTLKTYSAHSITPQVLRELAQLSPLEDGPLRARAFLANYGVALIIEPQLPHTHLDGAALLLDDGHPVIGLTLRHDRIDNFWFSLMHEMAHVSLHLDGSEIAEDFFDNLEVGPGSDPREIEADEVAGEALIPQEQWKASAASKVRAIPAALHLAHQLHIHPAIVAGRMRHQYKDFRVLASLVGQGEVRSLFPEINWP